MTILSAVGSLASILSLMVSLWVLWKERKIEADVTALKTEEEQWHGEEQEQTGTEGR